MQPLNDERIERGTGSGNRTGKDTRGGRALPYLVVVDSSNNQSNEELGCGSKTSVHEESARTFLLMEWRHRIGANREANKGTTLEQAASPLRFGKAGTTPQPGLGKELPNPTRKDGGRRKQKGKEKIDLKRG